MRFVLEEVLKRLEENDPTRREWEVRSDESKVWVDAGSMVLGALVQIGGVTIEDAEWLRNDLSEVHINMAELDAVLCGVNMALAWKLNKLQMFTDSVIDFHLISDAVTRKSRLRSKVSADLLVRRSLNLFRELVDDYNLDVNVNLISSKDNLADSLTILPGRWMRMLKQRRCEFCRNGIDGWRINFGDTQTDWAFWNQKTLHFVRKKFQNYNKGRYTKVIRGCEQCQSIDSAPVAWTHGKLEVNQDWK